MVITQNEIVWCNSCLSWYDLGTGHSCVSALNGLHSSVIPNDPNADLVASIKGLTKAVERLIKITKNKDRPPF